MHNQPHDSAAPPDNTNKNSLIVIYNADVFTKQELCEQNIEKIIE